MGAARHRCVVVVIGLVLSSCSMPDPLSQNFLVPGADAIYVMPDAGVDVTSPDMSNTSLVTITSCSPNHGPFVGGTALTIMGSGFEKTARVKVGGRGIQVGQSKRLSSSKIVVVTPAGKVGPADVEVSVGAYRAVAKGCFTYDPIYIDPSSGPTQGGTLVEIYGTGTAFKKGMKLQLGGKDFTDVDVVSATKLRAKTPAGSAGWADLTVGGTSKDTVVRESFRYYMSTNPSSGGLGGGPIKGTLTVSVLDGTTRNPIDGAKVVVEDALTTLFTGTTGVTGVLVFSKKNLAGPINVTAGKDKFETSTIASFDARDVTIFLFPIVTPSPGPGPPAKLAGVVQGVVVFGGTTGIGSEKWDMVPEPKTGENKRCYVYGTVHSIGAEVPKPQTMGTIDYVGGKKQTSWPFEIKVIPGMQAVYAVAGIYNKTTDKFVPHALGVARGVVVGPAETVKNVMVLVNSGLNQKIELTLKDVPTKAIMHKVRVAVDLGAEGFIVRTETDLAALGVKTSFTFDRMPSFAAKGLVDASYAIDVALDGSGTVAKSSIPYIRGTMRSVQPQNGELVMGKFVGPPMLTDPKKGGSMTNNTLTWTPTGYGASLAVVLLVDSKLTPVWRIISDGQNFSVKLPDAKAAGLKEIPKNTFLIWAQWMVHLPSYNFNKYNYNHLQSLYWDRWSQDQSYFLTQ